MNARLEPLEGKYYGTEVKITDGKWAGHHIRIWISLPNDGDLDPSERELERCGVIRAQYESNEQIGTYPIDQPDYCDGEPGGPLLAKEALCIHDSHFEGRIAHEAALALIKALETIKE